MTEWVSIAERLPDDDREVLVIDMDCANDYAFPYAPSESVAIAFFEAGNQKWYYGMGNVTDKLEMDNLTHWHELPQEPK